MIPDAVSEGKIADKLIIWAFTLKSENIVADEFCVGDTVRICGIGIDTRGINGGMSDIDAGERSTRSDEPSLKQQSAGAAAWVDDPGIQSEIIGSKPQYRSGGLGIHGSGNGLFAIEKSFVLNSKQLEIKP